MVLSSYNNENDFKLEVAKGNVTGHTQINKYGHFDNVQIGTPTDVWGGGGIYEFYFTTNQTVDAVSTDVDDSGTEVSSGTATGGSLTTLIDTGATFVTDGVAVGDIVINDTNGEWGTVNSVDSETQLTHTPMTNGSSVSPANNPNESGDSYRIGSSDDTGAGVIHVEGLTADGLTWSVATETIILNGTTDVRLSTGFVRMYRSFVLHAGSTGYNEGDITVDVVTTGEVGIQICATHSQTQQAIYTIPSGKTGYFIKGYVALARNKQTVATFTWRARLNNGINGVFAIKGQVTLSLDGSGWWLYEYGVPVAIPEKSDILIRCDDVSANGTGVVGAFDMILVDN